MDSCALIWLASEPQRLSQTAVAAINDPVNVLQVSHASLWEIALKHSVGKLQLPTPPRQWWVEQVAQWGLVELPLMAEDFFGGCELPLHHKDPFDRAILAQAQRCGSAIITADVVFAHYGSTVVW